MPAEQSTSIPEPSYLCPASSTAMLLSCPHYRSPTGKVGRIWEQGVSRRRARLSCCQLIAWKNRYWLSSLHCCCRSCLCQFSSITAFWCIACSHSTWELQAAFFPLCAMPEMGDEPTQEVSRWGQAPGKECIPDSTVTQLRAAQSLT